MPLPLPLLPLWALHLFYPNDFFFQVSFSHPVPETIFFLASFFTHFRVLLQEVFCVLYFLLLFSPFSLFSQFGLVRFLSRFPANLVLVVRRRFVLKRSIFLPQDLGGTSRCSISSS